MTRRFAQLARRRLVHVLTKKTVAKMRKVWQNDKCKIATLTTEREGRLVHHLNSLTVERILDVVNDGVYVLSPDGKYLYANNTIVQLSGVPKERFFEYSIYQMKEMGMISHLLLDTTLEKGTQHTSTQRIVSSTCPKGVTMMTSQFPVFNEKNQISYVVGVMRNMEDLWSAYNVAKNSMPVVSFKSERPVVEPIVNDPKSLQLLEMARIIARSDASVLLTGASGVGKEVWADYIHMSSPRSGGELVKINCASLPDSLLEAELFGYMKGSFTGALSSGKIGLIEQADGGTLFLDEINSMPLSVQGKLLRVLENKTVRRIGSTVEKSVNFRLLSATNENLDELVQKKMFRQDLYYRCNVVPLHVPPLKERKLDIRPLCQAFLQRYQQKYGTAKTFSTRVLEQLEEAEWPGNVRELKNFIERAVLLTDPAISHIEEIPAPLWDRRNHLGPPFSLVSALQNEGGKLENDGLTLKEQTAAFEQRVIAQTIKKYGSISQAAVKLGVDRSTLIRKMKK